MNIFASHICWLASDVNLIGTRQILRVASLFDVVRERQQREV